MSNRSGTAYSAPTDADRRPTLLAVNSSDGITPEALELDTVDGGLLVHVTNGGSGGTASTFGQSFPSTGTAIGASYGGNMVALNEDSSGNLLVNVAAGGGGGTQYQELSTTSPATGNLSLGRHVSSFPTLTNGQMNEPLLSASSIQYATINDGTNTANVVAGDTGFNGVATSSATKTYTFTTSSSGAQTILANTNVEGYSTVEVVYTSVGTGLALTGQFSTASGGTYVSSSTFAVGAGSTTSALGLTVNTIYRGPVVGNYFQIAVSALTSGTFSGTVTLRSSPTVPSVTTVNTTNTSANTYTGQTTVNTTQVQLSSTSHALINGIRLKAPSTNSAGIYYGLTGVTTSTGDLIEPGESVVYPISNTNLLYIISAASSTDKITWSGN